MSYLAAAQSALFYFLACTPCNQLAHHHKQRQQAKKEKEIKERIVTEQPHLYRHPDPFHTNPYWSEEIRMGPSLPKKRKGSEGIAKSLSQRRLTAVSRDGRPSIGTGSSVVVSMSERGSIASPRASTSPVNAHAFESAPTVVTEEDPASPTLSKTVSISTSADWNLKRYQREDEELWGQQSSWSGHKLMDAIKQAGTTAGRYMESKLGLEKQVTEEDRYNFYFTPRNPPVNDFHPPVVSSKPAHKDSLRWMLQPPPPAKVMEGKVPVTRSASTMSAASSRRTVSTREAGSLGRLVGERAVEARIRRGEVPPEDERRSTASLTRTRSRVSSAAARTNRRSRRTARTGASRSSSSSSSSNNNNNNNNNTSSTESDDEPPVDHFSGWRRRTSRGHRPPVSEDEADEAVHVAKTSPEPESSASLPSHAAQRPRLPTILSSGQGSAGSPGPEVREASDALRDITNADASKAEPIALKDQPAMSVPAPARQATAA